MDVELIRGILAESIPIEDPMIPIRVSKKANKIGLGELFYDAGKYKGKLEI